MRAGVLVVWVLLAGSGLACVGYPAFKSDLPQVLSSGGPVLANPLVVPIFFANDDFAQNGAVAQITGFLNSIGGSTYWTAAVGEYGVGPLIAATPFMSGDTPTGMLSDYDVQQWLLKEMKNDPGFPQPTAETIYAIHYPAGVIISTQEGAQSCMNVGAWHNDLALPPQQTIVGATGTATVATNPNGLPYGSYAVIPRCTSLFGLQGLDVTTAVESHELAEASTDPYDQLHPAFDHVDDAHFAWQAVSGFGEIGDLCTQRPGAFAQFAGLDFTVQRIWSNRNARAGHDPCQPELPGEVYFNAAAELPDTAQAESPQGPVSIRTVNVPAGTSTTIMLDLSSDGDTRPLGGDWNVKVVDLAGFTGGVELVSFSVAPTHGRNGDQLQLTIAPTATLGGETVPFFVESTLGNFSSVWIGTITF